MAIGSFKLPNVAASAPVDPFDWTRPADWLTMPTIGTQEFIGLLAITDDSVNYVAVQFAGNYTVDWGDGVTENVATGIKAQHQYTYSSISNSTISTRGYKQVLVRVTPQSGQNLTIINLQQQHSILAKIHTVSWLDIAMRVPNATTINIGGNSAVYLSMVENVDVYSFAMTSLSSFFQNLYALKKFSLPSSTSTITNFSNMCYACYSLKTIPLFSTSSGTNFSFMFFVCYALESIPVLNTVAGNNFNNMFNGCTSLKEIPLINTALGTNLSNMFTTCRSLTTVPLLNTVLCTNFTAIFENCTSIQNSAFLNTSAGTTFTSMFNGCISLQTLPNFNTALGTNSFLNVVNGCTSLAKGAFQGTRYAISYANMCLSQTEIVNIFNGLGTAVVAQTITVTNNPGRATVTPGEIAIATGKGWTVV